MFHETVSYTGKFRIMCVSDVFASYTKPRVSFFHRQQTADGAVGSVHGPECMGGHSSPQRFLPFSSGAGATLGSATRGMARSAPRRHPRQEVPRQDRDAHGSTHRTELVKQSAVAGHFGSIAHSC